MLQVPGIAQVAHLNDPQLQKTVRLGGAHRDTVNSLAFSPDGELLASGGYREVKLWRRAKPADQFKLRAGGNLLSLNDHLPPSYLNQWVKQVSGLRVGQVQAAATKYLDPEHMPIVVVGDRAKIEPLLRATGIPVVILP